MTDLRLSRRAVTRALITLPTVAVAASLPASMTKAEDPVEWNAHTDGRSAWDAAIAHYRHAKAQADAYNDKVMNPLYDKEEARFGDAYHIRQSNPQWAEICAWRDEVGWHDANLRFDALVETEHSAKWALLLMPAPDLAALRFKLEDVINTPEGIQPYGKDYAAVLVDDYQRLLPVEA